MGLCLLQKKISDIICKEPGNKLGLESLFIQVHKEYERGTCVGNFLPPSASGLVSADSSGTFPAQPLAILGSFSLSRLSVTEVLFPRRQHGADRSTEEKRGYDSPPRPVAVVQTDRFQCCRPLILASSLKCKLVLV